jgi:hypothetical protein
MSPRSGDASAKRKPKAEKPAQTRRRAGGQRPGQRAGSDEDAPALAPAFAPVAAAFARHRDVAGGVMMASFGLRVKGKIFAMHVRGDCVVKLPRARVDALVASGAGRRFEPGPGRIMKEWVAVPPGAADWVVLAREAYAFVKGAA